MIIIICLVTCSSYLREFLRVQWLHFSSVVDKVIIDYVNCFRIVHTKTY